MIDGQTNRQTDRKRTTEGRFDGHMTYFHLFQQAMASKILVVNNTREDLHLRSLSREGNDHVVGTVRVINRDASFNSSCQKCERQIQYQQVRTVDDFPSS